MDSKKINMRQHILLLFAFFIVAFGNITAQNFHRNYPPLNDDEKITVLDAFGLDDGKTLVLFKNIITTPDTTTTHVVLSLLDMKGGVERSIQYDIVDAFEGRLIVTEQDTFYAVVSTAKGLYTIGWQLANIVNPEVALMHSTLDAFGNRAFETSRSTGVYYLGTQAEDLTGEFISISRYNERFEPIDYKKYSLPDSLGKARFGDFEATIDTTLLFSGSINDTSFYVALANWEGEIFQSYRYFDTTMTVKEISIASQAALPDSSVVVVGNYLSDQDEKFGFVASIDKKGLIQWSKSVAIPTSTDIQLNKVIADWDSGVIITGLHRTDNLYPLSLKLSRQGEPLWQKEYNRMAGDRMQALFNTSDRSSGVFYQDTTSTDHKPSYIKLDTNGSSTCEEDIEGDLFKDITWMIDTLVWTIENYEIGFQTIDSINIGNHQYRVPEVNLEIDTYCPNEPVNHLFDPKLTYANPANVTYLWNTGATTDTLRVFDKEEYTLITTIDEEVCFTLCDTVKILEYGAPTASLQLLSNRFCEEGVLEIRGNFFAESGNKSIVWSTGEVDVNSITITQIGDYTVIFTDNCDQTVTRTLAVSQWPKRVENVTITDDTNVDCFLGTFSGSLTAQGDAIILNQTYLWSTGATGSNLNLRDVTETTYTVTVTDECGDTAVNSITLNLAGPGITSANINRFRNGDCDDITYNLNVTANQNGNFTYLWSTGATSPNIVVDDAGTYTVTVTDACGNSATANASLNAADFEPERPTVSIRILLDDEDICNKSATLFAESSRARTYEWSNNTTASELIVQDPGRYGVTVTDICGNTASASANISQDTLLPPDLKYAHVFFPKGIRSTGTTQGDSIARARLIYNRTFGPVIDEEYCFDLIEDYEFYVFNRWGQKVFEGRRLDEEWDGMHSEQDSASDTYVWVVRYKILGIEKVLKGDVTLLRE